MFSRSSTIPAPSTRTRTRFRSSSRPGLYDLETKLAAYRERGDEEIWLLHPYERTLTAWRRQADGNHVESTQQGGIASVASLPGVSIDPDTLLDDEIARQ